MIILAATPIGNLGDATRRLVDALGTAEVIASEDTRTTIHLMRALGIENRPRLIALHEHNEVEKTARVRVFMDHVAAEVAKRRPAIEGQRLDAEGAQA